MRKYSIYIINNQINKSVSTIPMGSRAELITARSANYPKIQDKDIVSAIRNNGITRASTVCLDVIWKKNLIDFKD